MADSALSARLRSSISLALIGSVTLFAALIVHDIFSFGPSGHDLIAPWGTPCTQWPCSTMNLLVSGQVAKAVGAALVFGLIGAFTISRRGRLGVGGVFWTFQFAWSVLGIASGYRSHFGTTWRWWEPFAEVMWAPALTLPLFATGLAGFLGLTWLTTDRPTGAPSRRTGS